MRALLRDVLSEALAGLLARPSRAALTTTGPLLGVASIVATIGIAQSAGGQIVGRFDELVATSVSAYLEVEAGAVEGGFSLEDLRQVGLINGVEDVGAIAQVSTRTGRVTNFMDTLGVRPQLTDIYAVSPGYFGASRAALGSGLVYDEGHAARGDAVAILGSALAARLGVSAVDGRSAVFLEERAILVVGILAESTTDPRLRDAVLVPGATADRLFGSVTFAELLVRTELGAAHQVADEIGLATSPENPGAVQVVVPPDPVLLRANVEADVSTLFLVLGGVALLAGAIGIANVTLVAVLERREEIGLRRALGATQSDVASQFLLESALVGAIGGILGSSVGVVLLVSVSMARQWTPILNPALPLLAPLLSTVVGLVAGVYPAWKASRLEPVDALRR